ncbi:MAG: PaaI family thioesterase [Paracoccus sp. (in: a-proteobacteria)]|nr:PaaI family thioesterase [Paracoccus sp. (in: a-proteobacteria)]
MSEKMDAAALNRFLAEAFPQIGGAFRVEAVAGRGLAGRWHVGEAHLRPGGTVSGPTMFALADVAFYCNLLAQIGPVALAVTTNASIDFMRKPEAGRDLVAHSRILKLGRQLAVGDVLITNDGSEAVLARASMTYAIPPERRE